MFWSGWKSWVESLVSKAKYETLQEAGRQNGLVAEDIRRILDYLNVRREVDSSGHVRLLPREILATSISEPAIEKRVAPKRRRTKRKS